MLHLIVKTGRKHADYALCNLTNDGVSISALFYDVRNMSQPCSMLLRKDYSLGFTNEELDCIADWQ